MSDIHNVKSWTFLFEAVANGLKTHDIRRRSDRDYKVGDVLILEEYNMATGAYTGRALTTEITYITSIETPCALSSMALHPDACVLSLRVIR